MRARYAVEPLGHYGLAKTRYTHFTSPIRRYADLVVHRVLFEKQVPTVAGMREIADHITDTERNSADAERDSKDVKLYAWLTGQLDSGRPEIYDALITDVRNFGFFVDVPGLGMSGAVPLSSIQDDFYNLDPVRNEIVGRHSRRVFKLGDRLKVQIYKLDRFKKQVDFASPPLAAAKAKESPSSKTSAAPPAPHKAKADQGSATAAAQIAADNRTGIEVGPKRRPPRPGQGQNPGTRPPAARSPRPAHRQAKIQRPRQAPGPCQRKAPGQAQVQRPTPRKVHAQALAQQALATFRYLIARRGRLGVIARIFRTNVSLRRFKQSTLGITLRAIRATIP